MERESTGYVPPQDHWGPFVSERAWGTVREDYSSDGNAWEYFPREHAHLRAFRWGEDAIAGLCDRYQVLILAPVFWNGADPLLKERLFGLSPLEGNHGEDVKELYYRLDATPTHSYLKYLYKYPQSEFPAQKLIEENQKRGKLDPEYELIDTNVFDEDRYFDIVIEYAKADPDDIVMRIQATNRGPDPAPLHLLPQFWFRNQWSWGESPLGKPNVKPLYIEKTCVGLVADDTGMSAPPILRHDYHLKQRYLYASPGFTPLFTENETNREKLWGMPNESPFTKDAFHRYLVEGEKEAVNPKLVGTKAACHYFFPSVQSKESVTVTLRLTSRPIEDPLGKADVILKGAKAQADTFYQCLHPQGASEEEKALQRQALAGLIWNKQLYYFEVGRWIEGDNSEVPPPRCRRKGRNHHWRHLAGARLFTMPDKWEFPWFAAWDTAFHSVALSLVDLEFSKLQLWLLLFDQYQHPNGALPAYEWEFSDVNPPLQAWAILKIAEQEKKQTGKVDTRFIEECFHRLLLNFSWWVNQVDPSGSNVFEGGFLGMDNISLLDRSLKLPPGYTRDQADGAGWMSLFCLNLMRMSLLLADQNPSYELMGIKFFSHFLYLTAAMRKGYWRHYDLWNEEDAYFYSVLRTPDGNAETVPIRSLVGMVPFFASDIWDEEELKRYPRFYSWYRWIIEEKPNLAAKCIQTVPTTSGTKHLFGLLSAHEIQRFLTRVIRSDDFGSPFGLRSLSKHHEKHPVSYGNLELRYEPGEAEGAIKGGNSNWRGPIWVPINYLFIDTLKRLGTAFEGQLTVPLEGKGDVTLLDLSREFSERLIALFKRDKNGKRPYLGEREKLQHDPHFRDYFLFPEFFHAETGRGLGACQQTGWTALIASLIGDLRK